MGSLLSALRHKGLSRGSAAGLAFLLLVALERMNRRNLFGLALWLSWHVGVQLPLCRLFARVCSLFGLRVLPACLVFSFRAQVVLDTTRHANHHLYLPSQQRIFDLVKLIQWPLVREKPTPVRSSKAEKLLSRSIWLGSDELLPDASVLLFIHGGGFVFGNPSMWSWALQQLCDASLERGVRLKVLSVDYPLGLDAPDNGFQRNIETLLAAFDYLVEERGVQPHRIVIGGDSAGGNLAAVLTMALRDRVWRKQAQFGRGAASMRASLPAAVLLVSPWLDMTLTARWRTRHEPKDPFAHAGETGNTDIIDRHVLNCFAEVYMANTQRRAQRMRRRQARGAHVEPWQLGEETEPPIWEGAPNTADAPSKFTWSASHLTAPLPTRPAQLLEVPCTTDEPMHSATPIADPAHRFVSAACEDFLVAASPKEISLTEAEPAPEAALASLKGSLRIPPSFSLISPARGDVRHFPPVHIVYGRMEMFAPDIAAFVAQLRAAGVVVNEDVHRAFTHNFVLLDVVFGREASEAWTRCADFVCEQLLQRQRQGEQGGSGTEHTEGIERDLFPTDAFRDAHP